MSTALEGNKCCSGSASKGEPLVKLQALLGTQESYTYKIRWTGNTLAFLGLGHSERFWLYTGWRDPVLLEPQPTFHKEIPIVSAAREFHFSLHILDPSLVLNKKLTEFRADENMWWDWNQKDNVDGPRGDPGIKLISAGTFPLLPQWITPQRVTSSWNRNKNAGCTDQGRKGRYFYRMHLAKIL